MTRYLLACVLVLLIGYGFAEAWPLLRGPSLSISSPQQDTPYPGGTVLIAGRAVRTSTLTVNGAPMLHDQDGNFSSTLTFPRGGSILTFKAADRFGRSVVTTRTIFVP